MNMAVNQISSASGYGSGAGKPDVSASGFAQLLLGILSTSETDQPSNPLLQKGQEIAATLSALGRELDLGGDAFSIEDLQAFLAGDNQVVTQASPELLDALRDAQDLMRDILDILPGIVDDLAALNADLADQEMVSIGAIVEGLQFVQARMQATAGDVKITALSVQFGTGQGAGSPQGQLRQAPGLALVSELEGFSVPEPRGEPFNPISPSGFSALRAMVIGAIQSSGQAQINSKDVDQHDPTIVTLTRTEPAFQDNLEHLEMTQQAQKSSNEVPTKFASVLINQVSAVDIQEGTTRIELTPRGLGTVEVEMRTNSDGSLSVVVRAENHAVLSSLRQEHDLLAAVITEHHSVDLDFQEFEQGREQSDTSGFAAPGSENDDGIENGGVTAGLAQPILDGETLDLMT